MSRIFPQDRDRAADAYLTASRMVSDYIRAGVKLHSVMMDHGFNPGTTNQGWGYVIGRIAAKIMREAGAVR